MEWFVSQSPSATQPTASAPRLSEPRSVDETFRNQHSKMKYSIPESALAQHIAVLGKTGAGKTNTGKTIVEHVVERDFRVCILDTLKSDWWGLISSADGKRPGLPFHILGGPRGHVPVHAAAGKAIAELVAVGTLPLSIVDMSDFAPGGQAKFFVDFAPTLMRKMKGVLYLVLEEAHLLAPKERSGMGDENMMIHFAKLLATAGRSKGIRLIVLSQRTLALHNAVLGSCETMIAHRMTAPADQEQVIKWLKANVKDKDLRAEIEGSLSSLRTGTAWVCSGEAELFKRVEFPKAITFDNTATPDGNTDDIEVRTAAVDRDKLRAIVGDAVAEAQANDPAELKKQIAELKRQLAAGGKRTNADIVEARLAGERDGYQKGYAHAACQMKQYALSRFEEVQQVFVTRLEQQAEIMSQSSVDARPENPVRRVEPAARAARSPDPAPTVARARQIDGRASARREKLSKAERKILTALAQYPMGRTKTQVAVLCAYAVTGGGFNNALGALRSRGFIEGTGERLVITDTGLAALGSYEPLPTGAALLAHWLPQLSKAERAALETLARVYPKAMAKEDLATITGYEASGGGFNNALGRLRTLELISGRGELRASEDLF